MATAQEIAGYIAKVRNRPAPVFMPFSWGESLDFLTNRFEPALSPLPAVDEAEVLAKELYADAEWKALQLATFLSGPNGKLIAEGVGLAIPPVFEGDYNLWLSAMNRAAQMQYTEGAKPAGRFALTASAVALILAGVTVIGRQGV
jgi:hypothetical protein